MTLEEIAQKCGVSKSTVSRALSGKGRIGKATKERIINYIKSSGRQSDGTVLGKTVEKRTGNIGVVIPADTYVTSMPFFQECLLGISEAASSEGCDVLITTGTATDYSGVISLVEKNKVDGIILMRTYNHDLTLEYLIEQGIPIGLAGQCESDEVIQAGSDNREAALSLTSRLIDCGYRKFAIIVGDYTYRVNGDRIEGFSQALDRYGLSREQQLFIKNFKWNSYVDTVIHDIFAAKIECIICGDDVICSRMMSSLQAQGYRIPLDIGVASLYNGATLDCFMPAVTAVNISARRQGMTVGRQLIRCINGGVFNKRTTLEYELLIRGSTGMSVSGKSVL